MEIEVYDTYAQSENGSKILLDVMLPIGGDKSTAKKKAKEVVKKISENTSLIKLESIHFSHTETSKLEVEEKVAKDGYCIVPIEKCPDPY